MRLREVRSGASVAGLGTTAVDCMAGSVAPGDGGKTTHMGLVAKGDARDGAVIWVMAVKGVCKLLIADWYSAQ